MAHKNDDDEPKIKTIPWNQFRGWTRKGMSEAARNAKMKDPNIEYRKGEGERAEKRGAKGSRTGAKGASIIYFE